MTAKWFETLYPKVKRKFPPPLKIEMKRRYKITIKENSPRIVPIGRGRQTGVIEIEHKGESYSLYLSHVDLARQIANLEDEVGSLMNVTIEVTQKEMKGRTYRYSVKRV